MTEHSDPVDRAEAHNASGGTPLPFDPVGKTHYTAEEFRAVLEGASPPTDEKNRTVLAAHPDRPATREELLAFVE